MDDDVFDVDKTLEATTEWIVYEDVEDSSMLEFLIIMTGRAQNYYADSSSLGRPITVVKMVVQYQPCFRCRAVIRGERLGDGGVISEPANGTYDRQGTGHGGYLVLPARSGLAFDIHSIDVYRSTILLSQ